MLKKCEKGSAILIAIVILVAGVKMLDAIAESADSPSETKQIINNSKQGLVNYEEGIKEADELKQHLDNWAIK